MSVAYLTLLDRRWKFKQVPYLGEDRAGACSEPDKPHRTIWVLQGLDDEDFLRVFLHEAMHALNWQTDEEIVDKASTELAHIIVNRFGYHRERNCGEKAS